MLNVALLLAVSVVLVIIARECFFEKDDGSPHPPAAAPRAPPVPVSHLCGPVAQGH